jgi:hypothetical protein
MKRKIMNVDKYLSQIKKLQDAIKHHKKMELLKARRW